MPSLRTLLILGRTSNLPTVWSNCLAGWWLGGHEDTHKLPALFIGATLLYLGGMFLNDAFDEGFDSQYRRERPIPRGAIAAKTVWQIGLGMLAAGLLALFLVGISAGLLGIILVGCIFIYDAIHKVFTLSPLLMAACRFLLYLVAASTASDGINGEAVWCGLALAAYIVGLSFLARKEATRSAVDYWPVALLMVPILMALLMNAGSFAQNAWLLSGVLALWMVRSLRYAFRAAERNIGRAVSGLLAGIVLVDLLAVADVPRALALIFLGLLAGALVLQRFVPAT